MVAANSSETSVITNNHGDIPHNTVIFINNVVSTSYRYLNKFYKVRHTKLRFEQTKSIFITNVNQHSNSVT